MDDVKFRTWVGMGRCQGGFCTSRVLRIMAEEMGVSPLEIRQNERSAYILKPLKKDLTESGEPLRIGVDRNKKSGLM